MTGDTKVSLEINEKGEVTRVGVKTMKKKIGIVGFGHVGKAMARFFDKHYEVVVHDTALNPPGVLSEWGSTARLTDRAGINECDLAVICVPTPMLDGGMCDTSIVEEVVGWIDTPLILLKSTVSPGTTERLMDRFEKRVVFSPEYCGESSYWTPYAFHRDIVETPFFIFGGHSQDTTEAVDFFLPVAGPVKKYVQTDPWNAELAKYMENSFYALKIAFCYEFSEIAKAMGMDFNEVRELWLLDPRINPMHTAVFAGNKKPFGGKCLPKDVAGIIEKAESAGYDPQLLKEVLATNERIGKLREEKA